VMKLPRVAQTNLTAAATAVRSRPIGSSRKELL
jgi:hypothetical protein